MKADRAYVRVYHDDLMRDYPSVYGDDSALATWLRLLVVADKMWPAPAELPRSVRPKPLAVLTSAGLVELVRPHCFRIRGYDAERSKRQESARIAAAASWQSRRSADALPRPNPSPSPSPKDPPYPPRGARSKTGRVSDRKAAPETLASILRRAAEQGKSDAA